MAASPHPQPGCGLVKLPSEVLSRVTTHFTTPELCALRLTCKLIERSMLPSFVFDFFRKRQFMVSSFSLGALGEMSKVDKVATQLRHVILGSDRATQTSSMNPQVRELYNDQLYLERTGKWTPMLAEALGRLPNLQTIELRNFASHTRYRDAGQWESYGAPTANRILPHSVAAGTSMSDVKWVSTLFCGILAAVDESKVTPPNLEVTFKGGSVGLADSAFYLPPTLRLSLKPYLEGLTKLHLTMLPSASDKGLPMLAEFLASTPNVKWLRLNFHHNSAEAHVDFLSWLARSADAEDGADMADDDDKKSANGEGHDDAASYKHPVKPIALPRLESLELGHCTITLDQLVSIFSKFTTLRRATLWRLGMVPENPSKQPLWMTSFDHARHEAEKKLNPVADLLRSLSVSRLRQLVIGEIRQRLTQDPMEFGSVRFSNLEPPRDTQRTIRSNGGTGDDPWSAAADHVVVDWPQPQLSQGSDDGSEDESDEGSEDGSDDGSGGDAESDKDEDGLPSSGNESD